MKVVMQIETDFDYVILLHTWHGLVHCLSTDGGSLLEWAVPTWCLRFGPILTYFLSK